jgi:hypothetical protein
MSQADTPPVIGTHAGPLQDQDEKGSLPSLTGPKISVSSDAWAEVLLTPREAARLAHVLLTRATQEDPGIGRPMQLEWQAAPGGSQITGWQLNPAILT